MNQEIRRRGVAAFAMIVLLVSQSADAGVCIWGECSSMTDEFRNLELRPASIVLLPARSSLTETGVFNSESRVGETAPLEEALGDALEKQISSRGYEVRRLTFDEIEQDQQLASLLNAANQRYDEEYATIVAFKVHGVMYRRYSVGEESRMLANYLGVDAIAFPRMQIVGASSGSKWMAAIPGSGGDSPGGSPGGSINMEFGLVHARTGDIEGFFGGVKASGGMMGLSYKKILKKKDKYMQGIAKTATKKMPKVGAVLKPNKLDEDEEVGELVLYDPVDEEAVLDDLEGLLDEE